MKNKDFVCFYKQVELQGMDYNLEKGSVRVETISLMI